MAYRKDIWRSITKSLGRFLSILVITALGVTVLTGIYAACQDMYHSADRFYDEQQLFDVRVLSTLGLTQADVEALEAVEGIAACDGGYNETVHTLVGGARQTANMVMLGKKGLNRPYVEAGRLPTAAGEVAVTQKYLDASGLGLGDSLEIEEDLEADETKGEDGAEPVSADPGEPAPAAGAAEDEDGDDPATEVDWDAEVELEAEAEAPSFRDTRYTITGVVIDPENISVTEGGTSFRSTQTTDYTFFVPAAAVDSELFTSIHLTLRGLAPLNCYGEEYSQAVQAVIERIENQIMKQRQAARYNDVMDKALDKLAEAEMTMEEKFTEADGLFGDAWAEVEDAKRELLDGEDELTREEKDALQKLADARAELEDGRAKLLEGEAGLKDGEATLKANAKKLEAGRAQLAEQRKKAEAGFAEAEALFAESQARLDGQRPQLEASIAAARQAAEAAGGSWPAAEWEAVVAAATAETLAQLAANPAMEADALQQAVGAALAGSAEWAALYQQLAALTLPPQLPADTVMGLALGLGILRGSQQMLDAQKAAYEVEKQSALAQLDAAEKELAKGQALIDAGWRELEEGKAELAQGWRELEDGEAKLNEEEAKALRELADAWRKLAEGRQELAEGEAELLENQAKYQDKKAEAGRELANAYAELEDIDMARWYVQDRSALDSYSALKNDLSSIEAVGRAFPVLFLLVAALISLTTMTRMVEEERGLIGTYKALGFSNRAIYAKYLIYALAAALLGGLLGDLLGFVVLPAFLLQILQQLYIVPNLAFSFNAAYGTGGIALFVASIVGATALACHSELRQVPAALMRPKAPRAGARVFLERIPAVWNRMSFLNKVTARNLFRYKKRLFMTVAGIMGCTALVLAGFAIKDSVADMLPKQYQRINRYHLMLVADGEDNGQLLALAENEAPITDWLNVQIENVKLLNAAGASESMQLMVVPNGAELSAYVGTIGPGGEALSLGGEGALITQNTSELLGLDKGQALWLQTQQLDRYETRVAGVVEYYMGNTVFLSQAAYEALFGPFEPNALLAHLGIAEGEQPAYAEGLLQQDFILSAVSTQGLKDDFSTNFAMINAVLYLLIGLAAGLAFVVLFTLANTNISERVRELATIKVLGFFNKEVHAYVNKETLLLTGLGVLAGLPLGRWVSGLLTQALKMPSVYFAVYVRPESYLLAGVIAFSFALVVNLITNRALDRINMVEALKSVE